MTSRTKLIKVDKNGTKYYMDDTCERCGGTGRTPFVWHEKGICFECFGSGVSEPRYWKEYTPEYQAKLDKARDKRYAKKQQKWINGGRQARLDKIGFTGESIYKVLGDTFEIKEQIKADGGRYNNVVGWFFAEAKEGYDLLELTKEECIEEFKTSLNWRGDIPVTVKSKLEAKARQESKSEYQGKIGDRITAEVTLTKWYSYDIESYKGWGMDTKHIYIFEDNAGNVYKWDTTAYIDRSEGLQMTIKGTVKDHSEYKGIKQTALTRVKVTQ